MTVLNNGYIYKGRPKLCSRFCSFCLLSKACVIIHRDTHTNTHIPQHTGAEWNATGHNKKKHLNGKFLLKIGLSSTFLVAFEKTRGKRSSSTRPKNKSNANNNKIQHLQFIRKEKKTFKPLTYFCELYYVRKLTGMKGF